MALSKKPYKGCRDFFPVEMRCREYLFETMKKVAYQYGFEPYDGPLVEEVELYQAKSGQELINEQIYSFEDRGKRFVAIRPEMTPTFARMVAQVYREVPKPIRWFSIPNLMRYEKPQRGRLREHWQLNADIFGAPENLGEIEILSLIVSLLTEFGADNSMFSIQINDRRVVDAIFTNLLQLDADQSYKLYKVIDKSKKVSEEALDKMINEIISDDSKKAIFKKYLALDSFDSLETYLKENKLEEAAASFLGLLGKVKKHKSYSFLEYDPTIVRGLDYYTGMVFEIFDKHPDNRRAIAGGGAYANLLQIFNEEQMAGIGFGLGDVTLRDFLETHKLLPDFTHAQNDLFICYFDEECEDTCLNLAEELRTKKLKVELNLGVMKFKKAFSAAAKKGHSYIALMGGNEKAAGEVQVKNLQTKEAKNFKLNDIEEIIKFINKG
jgi:histidyl-tRNA synthetase